MKKIFDYLKRHIFKRNSYKIIDIELPDNIIKILKKEAKKQKLTLDQYIEYILKDLKNNINEDYHPK